MRPSLSAKARKLGYAKGRATVWRDEYGRCGFTAWTIRARGRVFTLLTPDERTREAALTLVRGIWPDGEVLQ